MKRINLITTKSIFWISVLVITLTIIGVWFWGIGKHKTIYENSILSTAILSISFFLFITIGLYNGFKLKDNLGKLTKKPQDRNVSEWGGLGEGLGEIIGASAEGGAGGILIGILVWLAVSILILLFVWVLGPFIWTGVLTFFAILYWIFFRALRLVFKNSVKCHNHILLSLACGIFYTFLYNFWIYGIIFGIHYFKLRQ